MSLILCRPCSKVVIRFLTVMMKHGYIGEFEVGWWPKISLLVDQRYLLFYLFYPLSGGWRSSCWQDCGQPHWKAEQVRRHLAQVRKKRWQENYYAPDFKILFNDRFDIALNDIEKWTNNLLPSRQFGKVENDLFIGIWENMTCQWYHNEHDVGG